jgi:hypothetical protein
VTRLQQLARGTLLLAVAAGATGVVLATDAAAVSCTSVTISAGPRLTLSVSNAFVTSGGCVRFANLTDVTVTVRVSGSSFSARLPARTPASASPHFTATKSATVTATDGVRSGRGSITVSKASPTPRPTISEIRPTSLPSTAPGAKPSKSAKPSKTPKTDAELPDSGVATNAPAAVNTQHPLAAPAIPSLPPPPAGGDGVPATQAPEVSHPVVAPQVKTGSDPRLTSTVVEPVSGSGRGLPATVAVVFLLGLAAAYGRTVFAAEAAVERRAVRRPVRRTV